MHPKTTVAIAARMPAWQGLSHRLMVGVNQDTINTHVRLEQHVEGQPSAGERYPARRRDVLTCLSCCSCCASAAGGDEGGVACP